MVLLGRVMVCSHRLSIKATVVSGTVWPQFARQVLTEGCEPQFAGRGGLRELEMGPPGMGPMSRPVVTFYRFPKVTTGSYRFCSAPTCHGQTELV